MFSDELLELVLANERLKGISLAYQSAVIHAVEEEVERRYYTEQELTKKVLQGRFLEKVVSHELGTRSFFLLWSLYSDRCRGTDSGFSGYIWERSIQCG